MRFVRAFLYGIEPYDPVSVAGSILLLAGLGLAAAFVPARRAARIEPMRALRNDG